MAKVFRQCKLRMGAERMASFMYAVIIHRAKITDSYGVGIYKYSRSQNSSNHVDIMLEIDEDKLEDFEKLASIKFQLPQIAKAN